MARALRTAHLLLAMLVLAPAAAWAQEPEPARGEGDAAEAEKELFRSFTVPENRTANDLNHGALRMPAEPVRFPEKSETRDIWDR